MSRWRFREYAIEAAGLGAFTLAACAFTVLIEHPHGLANGSGGVVGRHYMGHVNSVLMAVSKCTNPTVFQKSLSANDFYFGDESFPFPMGHISFVGKLDGVTLEGGAPPLTPGFTLDLMARHSLDFWLTSEDLPDPENRAPWTPAATSSSRTGRETRRATASSSPG